MSKVRNYILTGNSVVVQFDDGIKPVDRTHPLYARIVETLKKGAFDAISDLMDAAKRITRYSNGNFWVKDGIVMIRENTLPDALSKRLLQFVDNGIDTTPLVRFYENLQQNPSEDSRQDLYGFLEHNGIPITEDGCFIAYKRVGAEFKDIHTSKLDYSVGKVVRMERNACDPDRNNTCSRGLHVAAHRYAKDFYGNGHMLECKVNPKDVVAVPVDYDNEKMRVCELVVVALSEGPRKELVYPHFAKGDQVVAENDDGSTVEGEVVNVYPAADEEVEASYDVDLGHQDLLSLGIGMIVTYKESRLRLLDLDDDDDDDDNDDDPDGDWDDNDGFDGYDDDDDDDDVVVAPEEFAGLPDDDRLGSIGINNSLADRPFRPGSIVGQITILKDRVANLEENSATKKDVADSTSQIITKLEGITRQMDKPWRYESRIEDEAGAGM